MLKLYLPAIGAGDSKAYSVDFTDWLNGDTIAGIPVLVPSGVSITGESNTATAVTFKATGLAVQARAVRITATTSSGQTLTVDLILTTSEPVQLAEAKARLRLGSDTSRDVEIAGLIAGARKRVEDFTGLVLARRSIVEDFDGFGNFVGALGCPSPQHADCFVRRTDGCGVPVIALRSWPINGTPAVAYQGFDDVAPVALAGTRYVAGKRPGLVFAPAAGWPSLSTGGAVRVTVDAGFSRDVLDVEAPDLIVAILMLVAAWFDRPDGLADAATIELPVGVRSICESYRLPGA